MSEMFSRKIKHLRKLLKLTLEEVAEKVDSSKSYIWELENKENPNPSAELVLKLSNILGCPMEYLINDKYNVGVYPSEKNTCLKCAKIKEIINN